MPSSERAVKMELNVQKTWFVLLWTWNCADIKVAYEFNSNVIKYSAETKYIYKHTSDIFYSCTILESNHIHKCVVDILANLEFRAGTAKEFS